MIRTIQSACKKIQCDLADELRIHVLLEHEKKSSPAASSSTCNRKKTSTETQIIFSPTLSVHGDFQKLGMQKICDILSVFNIIEKDGSVETRFFNQLPSGKIDVEQSNLLRKGVGVKSKDNDQGQVEKFDQSLTASKKSNTNDGSIRNDIFPSKVQTTSIPEQINHDLSDTRIERLKVSEENTEDIIQPEIEEETSVQHEVFLVPSNLAINYPSWFLKHNADVKTAAKDKTTFVSFDSFFRFEDLSRNQLPFSMTFSFRPSTPSWFTPVSYTHLTLPTTSRV